jgi:hypothetical protein
VLGDQDQRLDRGLPFRRVVRGLRQLGDVVRGVTQGDELGTAGQGDWIVEGTGSAFVDHTLPSYFMPGRMSQGTRRSRLLP